MLEFILPFVIYVAFTTIFDLAVILGLQLTENVIGTNLMTEMYQNVSWMMMRSLLVNCKFFYVVLLSTLTYVVIVFISHTECDSMLLFVFTCYMVTSYQETIQLSVNFSFVTESKETSDNLVRILENTREFLYSTLLVAYFFREYGHLFQELA